jgi:hypothetical protein
MTTLAFGLIAASCFFLWRRSAAWSWALVLLALAVGGLVFVGDVDFSTQLGLQL